MTSAEFKAKLEELGFGVAHARRMPRSNKLRAYIAVHHPLHPEADEVRWTPDDPDGATLYHHATCSNGYTPFDKYLTRINL